MRSSTDLQPTKRLRFNRLQVLRDGEYFGTFEDGDSHGKGAACRFVLTNGGLVVEPNEMNWAPAIFRVIYTDGTYLEALMEPDAVFGSEANRCRELSLKMVGDEILCGQGPEAFRL